MGPRRIQNYYSTTELQNQFTEHDRSNLSLPALFQSALIIICSSQLNVALFWPALLQRQPAPCSVNITMGCGSSTNLAVSPNGSNRKTVGRVYSMKHLEVTAEIHETVFEDLEGRQKSTIEILIEKKVI